MLDRCIDFEIKDGYLCNQKEAISWESFICISGKHIDLKKRVGKKIRMFRKGGNVYVSDHEWTLDERYKKNNIIAYCVHISAKGEALLEDERSRLNTIIGTNSLEWSIV